MWGVHLSEGAGVSCSFITCSHLPVTPPPYSQLVFYTRLFSLCRKVYDSIGQAVVWVYCSVNRYCQNFVFGRRETFIHVNVLPAYQGRTYRDIIYQSVMDFGLCNVFYITTRLSKSKTYRLFFFLCTTNTHAETAKAC